MDELKKKIIMWRTELERQQAGQGTMSVFDSICTYLGEQQREMDQLQSRINKVLEQSAVNWINKTLKGE